MIEILCLECARVCNTETTFGTGYACFGCEERRRFHQRLADAETALAKINNIRNSIVSLQSINWSEHIYPLVAALDAAGVEGKPFPADREYLGSVIDQLATARADLAKLKVDFEGVRADLASMTAQRDALAKSANEFESVAESNAALWREAKADLARASERLIALESLVREVIETHDGYAISTVDSSCWDALCRFMDAPGPSDVSK